MASSDAYTAIPVTPMMDLNTSDVNMTTPIPTADLDLYAIVVPLMWGTLAVVGSLGNALVIYTLLRHGDKNATNYFVINLAISDLAFLVIVLPFTATIYTMTRWIFGTGMCKITSYLIYVTLHATCLTLMAMTIDRYCAIVYAVRSMGWRTSKTSIVVCVVVWLVSFILSLPFAIYYTTVPIENTGDLVCLDVWPEPSGAWGKATIVAVVTSTYVIPLSVIIFCYARILKTLWRNKMSTGQHQTNGITSKKAQQQEKRRKRVTKMVASVVIVFATFWLPIHILNLWFKLDPYFPRTEKMFNVKIFAHTLSYANSCVNPFVYAFLSDGFRKAFRKTFPSVVQKYRICGGPNEEMASTAMVDRCSENTKATMTEERRLMQTDL